MGWGGGGGQELDFTIFILLFFWVLYLNFGSLIFDILFFLDGVISDILGSDQISDI